jgi:hypothetical protein
MHGRIGTIVRSEFPAYITSVQAGIDLCRKHNTLEQAMSQKNPYRKLNLRMLLLAMVLVAPNAWATADEIKPPGSREIAKYLDDPSWQCLVFSPAEFIVDFRAFKATVVPQLEKLAVEEHNTAACNVLATLNFNRILGPMGPSQVERYLSIPNSETETNPDYQLNRAMLDSARLGRQHVQEKMAALAAQGHPASRLLRAMAQSATADGKDKALQEIESLKTSKFQFARLLLFKIFHKGHLGYPKQPQLARELCEHEVTAGNRHFYSHWLSLLDQSQQTAEAIRWSRKWTEAGEIVGIKRLMLAHISGKGAEESPKLACQLARQGADLGDSTCQFIFGRCCCAGHGCEVDLALGRKYLQLAIENGNADARQFFEMQFGSRVE